MIQYIYLPTSIRMSIFILVAITEYGGVRIGFVAGRVDGRTVALLRSLSLDILGFTAWAGLLGNNINHFVLILKRFPLLLPLMLRVFVNVSQPRPWFPWVLLVHPWWTSGRNACQNSLQIYVTYNFTHAFLTLRKSINNAVHCAAWASFPLAYLNRHQS